MCEGRSRAVSRAASGRAESGAASGTGAGGTGRNKQQQQQYRQGCDVHWCGWVGDNSCEPHVCARMVASRAGCVRQTCGALPLPPRFPSLLRSTPPEAVLARSSTATRACKPAAYSDKWLSARKTQPDREMSGLGARSAPHVRRQLLLAMYTHAKKVTREVTPGTTRLPRAASQAPTPGWWWWARGPARAGQQQGGPVRAGEAAGGRR
jgi:hypothetical protein